MIILCQGDFREQTEKLVSLLLWEQIEKLVSLLLYITGNCSEKTKPGHILYLVSNLRINGLTFRNSQPAWSVSLQ